MAACASALKLSPVLSSLVLPALLAVILLVDLMLPSVPKILTYVHMISCGRAGLSTITW